MHFAALQAEMQWEMEEELEKADLNHSMSYFKQIKEKNKNSMMIPDKIRTNFFLSLF